MSYTERFTETHKLLYHEPADSQNAVFLSGWLSVANYHRAVAILSVGEIQQGGTVDMLIQGARDSSGTGAATITGKLITQLTQAGGDGDDAVIIEVRTEELSANNFDYIKVIVTPGTAASELALLVFGIISRFEPVGTTEWTEVID